MADSVAGTMAGTIIQGAQGTIDNAGAQYKDAADAFQFAQNVQAKRQALEQQKQEMEIAKANNVTSSISNALKLQGNGRQIALKAVTDNVQKLYPDANPDTLQLLQKDSDAQDLARQALPGFFASGGGSDPTKAGMIGDILKTDPATFMSTLKDAQEQSTKLAEARIKATTSQTIRQGALDSRQDLAAQRTMNNDSLGKTYTQRIDGASKILNLISAAETSKDGVKANQAILGQLNAEISRLETGSQAPGLGASEKTEMQDAAAKFHNVLDTLSGNVTGVDLKAKFAQAKGMVKDLGQSYVNQTNDHLNYLSSGAVGTQGSVFQAKKDAFNKLYGNRFGGAPSASAGASPSVNAPAGISLPPDVLKSYQDKAKAALSSGSTAADLTPFLQKKGLDQATIDKILKPVSGNQ